VPEPEPVALDLEQVSGGAAAVNDPALAADALAVLHGAYVLFVLGGQVAILLGWYAGWGWTRNPWFRWLHLGAIGLVVLEVVLGVYCPLTWIEAELRLQAGQQGYADMSFVGYWINRLLYYEIPLWQAHVAYVLFAALVVWSFVRYPPRQR